MDLGIPKEVWTSKTVHYSFTKDFGYEEFLHIENDNKTKLEEKYKKCSFIEDGVDIFCYRLLDYENEKIIRSRDVVFNEKVMFKDQLQRNKYEKENTR